MTFPNTKRDLPATITQPIDDLSGTFQQPQHNLLCIFQQLLHDHPPSIADIYNLLIVLYENVNYMKHSMPFEFFILMKLYINRLMSSSPVGKSLIHWSPSASSDDSDNRDAAGTALIEAQFCKWNITIILLY